VAEAEGGGEVAYVLGRVAQMTFAIEFEQESDGRWIADIPELRGVMVYGNSREEAKAKVEALALRVLADRIESESLQIGTITFAAA
jgi:predicted RNase H-like HicB family nuclease